MCGNHLRAPYLGPAAQPRCAAMKATTWLVRRSGFPFTTHGQPLGTVQAATRDKARELAELEYGGRVTVEPERPTNAPLERAMVKLAATQRATERRGYTGPRRRSRPLETDDRTVHESTPTELIDMETEA